MKKKMDLKKLAYILDENIDLIKYEIEKNKPYFLEKYDEDRYIVDIKALENFLLQDEIFI